MLNKITLLKLMDLFTILKMYWIFNSFSYIHNRSYLEMTLEFLRKIAMNSPSLFYFGRKISGSCLSKR